MINLHTYLTQPDKLDVVVKLIRAGVIADTSIITHIRMYEEFMLHESPKRMIRYKALADKYNLSIDTIRRIIKKLKQQVR